MCKSAPPTPSGPQTFISYSHKDRRIAKSLVRFLEHNIPKLLQKRNKELIGRKQQTLPKSLGTIFLDENHLDKYGNLKKKITQALTVSKHLLVISSCHSHAPNKKGINWINREIRLFINPDYSADNTSDELSAEEAEKLTTSENSRSNYIYTLRIPPSRWLTACGIRRKERQYNEPANITMLQTIGELINQPDGGKERAYTNLAASILGIDKDQLWDHLRKEIQRQKSIAWICRIILTVFFTALITFLLLFFVPQHSYYLDYEEHNFIPAGLYPIEEEDLANYPFHYKFTKQCFLLQKVECLNARNQPEHPYDAEWQDRHATISFTYDFMSGRVTSRTLHDIHNTPIITQNIEGGNIISLRKTDENLVALGDGVISLYSNPSITLKANDVNKMPNASIQELKYEFDDEGRVKYEFFLNNSHKRMMNEIGAMGRRFEVKKNLEKGTLIRSVRYINSEREIIRTRTGISGYDIEYKNGLPVSLFYVGSPESKRVLHPEGFSGILYEWNGDIMARKTYVDTDGITPIVSQEAKFAIRTRIRKGESVETRFYSSDASPCINSDGLHLCKDTYRKDGKIIEQSYFGIEDEKICSNGVHLMTFEYQDKETKEVCRYYDTEKRPCTNKLNGSFGYSYQRIPNGAIEQYLDANDAPMIGKNGYAELKETFAYNEEDETVYTLLYHDANGHPCLNNRGYACKRLTVNQKGNIVKQEYLDQEGRPKLNNYGIARIEFMNNFDPESELYEISMVYKDEKNTKIEGAGGFAKLTDKRDTLGNLVETLYYQADGTEARLYNLYSRVTFKHENGQIKQIRYFADHKGRLCTAEDKPGEEYEYDERGRLIVERYINECEIPEPTPPFPYVKYCEKRYFYHDREKVKETHYIDNAGELLSIEREQTDEFGNVISKEILNNDKRVISRTEMKYDHKHRLIKTEFHDHANKLTINEHGISIMCKEYDSRDNCISQYYLDSERKPATCNHTNPDFLLYDVLGEIYKPAQQSEYNFNFSKIEDVYDARNRIIERKIYEAKNGQHVPRSSNFPICRFSYDGRGFLCQEDYFDGSETPYRTDGAYTTLKIKNNEIGNRTRLSYYDESKMPCINPLKGYATIKIEYFSAINLIL